LTDAPVVDGSPARRWSTVPAGLSREVLVNGAPLGDRFVAFLGEQKSGEWLSAVDVFGPALPGLLSALGQSRGTDNLAVAAALLFEQYAQRLVAPALAAFYLDGRVVDSSLHTVRVKMVDAHVRRLAFTGDSRASPACSEEARGALVHGLLAENLEVAAEMIRHRSRVSGRTLRGTIANAIASTLLHMSWPDPDRARYVREARVLLASSPNLADLVTVEAVASLEHRWMYTKRRTCCLAFRTATNQAREQLFCSACPVLPDSTTLALFARATAAYAAAHPGATA
jgi:ferric iron reductase protein FhuF